MKYVFLKAVEQGHNRPEGRRVWFTSFHVEATKKVTSILRLGKKDSFLGLQDIETKKIMQMS